MKNKAVIPILAANLAALVLLTLFAPQLMITPGKPIDAHAEIATDCFACHTPFFGSTADKCIACHAVEEIGIKTTLGLPIAKEKKNVAFHQQLIEEDCVACHSDHKGVKAFRPIGRFSHDLLIADLRQQCDGCHGNPGDALHLKIEGNCAQCHTQEAWLPATFDHDDYFRFDRHHDSECATCHINDDYANYTCYGCHEHSRSEIREEHVEEGIYDYESCVECHRSGDEDEAEHIWRSRRSGYYDKRKSGSFKKFRRQEDRYEYWDDDDDDDDD
ncbi:MAG: class III cytochrome C family protein [Candidatus Thiodiazotropha sp. (ex Dulcina madagascariensis)]|nr:class III cytochrome C family protein [Candidatus Thiodiazotropha sp. (ex Dulcina madagascariensis)]MCU7927204.1 class III cytochrome C family protein [Candidatus Thiodiazotropha sp. (ex Dulcina madagascariensis)]